MTLGILQKSTTYNYKKRQRVILIYKNPTITVCQEVARAYCGNIEVPADRRIIKPTQKLVSSLQDTEGYVYIKEMSLDYNKGDQYINNESDKIMNWKKQKQKQIIDDYKYEIGIAKERGTEPNIKIEESGIQQEMAINKLIQESIIQTNLKIIIILKNSPIKKS